MLNELGVRVKRIRPFFRLNRPSIWPRYTYPSTKGVSFVMAYWLGLPAPPVAIPDCATCGRQLSALTDVTSTGDWHNLCFNCRLGGANVCGAGVFLTLLTIFIGALKHDTRP
jgi:hypothetical protein